MEGIEKIQDRDCYKIKTGENQYAFFDKDTFLKVKEIKVNNMEGQMIEDITLYDDYKEVGGVLFPHIMSQGRGNNVLKFEVTEISVNPADLDQALFQ